MTRSNRNRSDNRRRSSSTTIRSEVNSERNMSRRQKSRKRKQMRYDKRQRTLIIGGLIVVLILAGVIGFATRRNGSDILVNDQSVGVIKTRNITKDDITNSVTAMLAEQVGTNVQIMDEIEIKGVHVSKKTNVMTTESLLAKLRDSVAYNIEAYAIAVDGNVVATLKNEQEAKEVLEYLNELYTPEGVGDAKITYKEDVQIVSQFTNMDGIMTLEDAKNKIALGESSTKVHTVATGQTLSTIASLYDMSLNELLELNPNLSTTSSIYVGQEITVKSNDPFITVQATVTVTEKETAEKEIEYQYDNTKSSSYKKIIQQGTNGVTEIKKEQLYINGIFDSEKIVSSNVVTQPVKEIVCIGTN